MRRFVTIVSLSMLVIASVSQGQYLGSLRPAKGAVESEPNVPLADRQGGDTVLDAVVIAALPFNVAGTTTGYQDDYDEICPFDTPGSPDVVYQFTPDTAVLVDVDLFGSTYDTKIYVYDEYLSLVACNDDFYPDYVSKLEELALAGDTTYYLVIDGYGGDHGDYVLSVTVYEPPPPCRVIAGCGASIEDEPPLEDGYIDVYNGGCNSEEYGAPFTDLPSPDPYFGNEFSGSSGWYLGPTGSNHRDTDWLRTIVDYGGTFEVEIESEQPVYLFQLSPTDCDGVAVVQQVAVDPCERASMYVNSPAGSEVWLWVGPRDFQAPEGFAGQEFRYRISLGGELGGSCLDLGPNSDYSFGCEQLMVDHHYTSFSTGSCANDVDFSQLCGGEPTPGGDVFVSVYLEAGQGIGLGWYPYYIKSLPPRSSVCMALVSDLRLDSRSCEDVECYSGYNVWGGLEVAATGWYWLVIDDPSELGSSEWGNISFNRVEPPTPPENDDCSGAATLPVGSFVIQDDLTDATNRFDPGRDGCPGAPGVTFTSRDVVYEVALTHGQTLDVTMVGEGGWEEVLYLIRDCENPVDNCTVSGLLEDGDRHLRYTALSDEVLWLVCDSYGLGPRPFTLTGSIDSTTDTPPAALAALTLNVAPNPFNPLTRITYEVPVSGPVQVTVCDLRGRVVRTITDEFVPAGAHEVAWDGRDENGRRVASGTYFCHLTAATGSMTRKMVLVQ